MEQIHNQRPVSLRDTPWSYQATYFINHIELSPAVFYSYINVQKQNFINPLRCKVSIYHKLGILAFKSTVRFITLEFGYHKRVFKAIQRLLIIFMEP